MFEHLQTASVMKFCSLHISHALAIKLAHDMPSDCCDNWQIQELEYNSGVYGIYTIGIALAECVAAIALAGSRCTSLVRSQWCSGCCPDGARRKACKKDSAMHKTNTLGNQLGNTSNDMLLAGCTGITAKTRRYSSLRNVGCTSVARSKMGSGPYDSPCCKCVRHSCLFFSRLSIGWKSWAKCQWALVCSKSLLAQRLC